MILPIMLSQQCRKKLTKEQTYRMTDKKLIRKSYGWAKNKYLDGIDENYDPVHRFDFQHKWLDYKH